MSTLKKILSVSLFVALAGCQSVGRSGPTAAGLRAMDQLASRPIDNGYMKAVDNLTTISFNSHGPQVSYRTADGRISLWYPGNPVLLTGAWKAVEGGLVCYKYGANTANPLTRVPGGNWECEFMQTLVGPFKQERKGDIFGLAKRSQVPFVTRKDRAQYDELVAKLPPPGPEDKASRGHVYRTQKMAEHNAKREQEIWKIVGQPPTPAPAAAPPKTEETKSEE